MRTTSSILLTALLLAPLALHALDYPHVTAAPQKTGWPPKSALLPNAPGWKWQHNTGAPTGIAPKGTSFTVR